MVKASELTEVSISYFQIERQMKVELVLDAGQAPVPPTLSQRVAPTAAGKART